MSYGKFYPGGWQSGETGGTPITPEALNHMEEGIVQAYEELAPAVESAEYPGCYYRTVNGVVEWINPPMVPGVEYRTTERYADYPVYTTLVEIGSVTSPTTEVITDFDCSNVLRFCGNVDGSALPYIHNTLDSSWSAWLNVFLYNGKVDFKIFAGTAYAGRSASAQAWYIKG